MIIVRCCVFIAFSFSVEGSFFLLVFIVSFSVVVLCARCCVGCCLCLRCCLCLCVCLCLLLCRVVVACGVLCCGEFVLVYVGLLVV